jgi:hypothetical protein
MNVERQPTGWYPQKQKKKVAFPRRGWHMNRSFNAMDRIGEGSSAQIVDES